MVYSLFHMLTPPKFNHGQRELPFPNHHFGYPAVSFHMSNVQNPVDIPLYCLVDRDPYNLGLS